MIASGLSDFARATIEALALSPHPEGGWYRRTWQSATAAPGSRPGETEMGEHACGARPLASLIYFLLPAGESSAWHVVDADELWLWHGPGPVTIELGGTGEAPDEDGCVRHVLCVGGGPIACGHLVVAAHTWQRTLSADADALVSCVVSPGFTYGGFSLAEGATDAPRGVEGVPRPPRS